MKSTLSNQLLWCRYAGKKFPQETPHVCIVDTNVFLGALPNHSNLKADQNLCTKKCLEIVELITSGHIKKIVVDINNDSGRSEILNEYFRNLSRFNEQGIAGKILQFLEDNNKIEYRTLASHSDHNYDEFPQDERLSKFDSSDKKFVAVSLADTPHYPIIQSMDGKWWRWATTLKDHDVLILFTNPDYAKKMCQKKNRCDSDCSKCPS